MPWMKFTTSGAACSSLGCEKTHTGVSLHLWARQLPSGMFDGHRSAIVSLDHLSFPGLTRRLVTATLRLLKASQPKRV